MAGTPSTEVCRHQADLGLFASNGDFYARTVVERLGLAREGLVRIGCACYTTEGEIGRHLHAAQEVARRPR